MSTPSVAIDNRDDLIEEYSGFGIRVETRKIGTERLGASLEWSTFDQTWQTATLAALELNPRIPAAYEQRIDGRRRMVTFAFTPHVRVSGGVSITELEPLSVSAESQMANAAIASIGYDQQWKPTRGRATNVEARFAVRAGSDALESDLVYTRYLGSGATGTGGRSTRVLASGMAGSHQRRRAALRTVFARRFGDAARLEQVRHRAGRRRSDVPRVARVPVPRAGAVPRCRLGVGPRHRSARIRVAAGVGFHSGPCSSRWDSRSTPTSPGRVHDGHSILVASGSRSTDLERIIGHAIATSRPFLVAQRGAGHAHAHRVARPRRLSGQSVTVSTVGGSLHVRAPGFGFIKGEPLARLKDGRSVRVDLELAVLAEARRARRRAEPADLRSELRSLGRTIRRDASGRAAAVDLAPDVAGAEAWCLEQLTVPVSALGRLGRDAPFWIRLEYRVLDGDSPPPTGRRRGFTLRGLIDALSRRRRTDDSTHVDRGGAVPPPRVSTARPRLSLTSH